jgi:hypothetical protein
MLWVGVHLAFQTPMARECQVHVAQPVHKHRTPSRRTSLLQTSPHRTITARILLLSRVPDNVPLAIHRYQTNSTYPTVSPTTPLIHCNNYLQSDTVINTLKAACIAQPSPATPFPIDPSQIFTLQPPSVYPNSTATSTPAPSSGLSYNAKLAIGITIPFVLLALLSILFLYWYVRIRPRSLKSKSNQHRCQHRGHPSIPSHPNQMSSYSASIYSQQTPYPEPLRICYSQPLTQSSGKRLSTIASTSPPTSPRAPTPSGLTSWERAGIRNSMQTRESRDLRRTSSERTNPMRSNSQRSNLKRTRSQHIFDGTNLPPSVKRGGTWKMKSQDDLFG